MKAETGLRDTEGQQYFLEMDENGPSVELRKDVSIGYEIVLKLHGPMALRFFNSVANFKNIAGLRG